MQHTIKIVPGSPGTKTGNHPVFLIKIILSLMFFAGFPYLEAQSFPLIKNLNVSDSLFKQLIKDIEWAYYQSTDTPYSEGLTFYQYARKTDDDLFSVAARVNLPYETIATLNDIEHPESFLSLDKILLPNRPGLFIKSGLNTTVDYVLGAVHNETSQNAIPVKLSVESSIVYFLPGERMSPVERAYFLGILYHFPLDKGYISSSFGPRKDPITGKSSFHGGTDIAAPLNTKVYAARGGTVIFTGWDDTYGNYIKIDHGGNTMTLYGHLNKINVSVGQKVASGALIGFVGSTGYSTGPHLHLEIWQNGQRVDPENYL